MAVRFPSTNHSGHFPSRTHPDGAVVSVSDWGGRGSPFASSVSYIGAENFRAVLVDRPILTTGTALRNNIYVLLVVPTNGGRPRIGCICFQPCTEGAFLLPTCFLLPLHHVIGSDHSAVAVPVLRVRCGEPGARMVLDQQLVQRSARTATPAVRSIRVKAPPSA